MNDSAAHSASETPAAPKLPRGIWGWLMIFGPGAIIASLTIGTGELIFSTRGGALFGYRILFLFVIISVLKWGLLLASSRHIMLTGVHPYERMLELPGPRGWILLMLLGMATFCLPIWISFHSGVLGNLTSWVTGTQGAFHGGGDYLWGGLILVSLLIVSALGGYTVLERIQTVIVLTMVGCAAWTLLLYQPDWLAMLGGVLPQPLSYPQWLPEKYPEIAKHSVWVETTRYVGVIGGAGFDYLAYTSWLREKGWGMAARRATRAQLEAIAADPRHLQRRWLRAPLVDASISFAMVVAFSAVFVASGAMILGPNQVVPDEDNMLNLQATLVTRIHAWLLPIYVVGAFLTMLGTLYGTIEIACIIADEIVRSFVREWTPQQARRLRRGCIAWCATIAFLILAWLFVRQVQPTDATGVVNLPKVLLNVLLTPVNLFTGVLFCGVVCLLNVWMDIRWLPRGLRLPWWLLGLNVLSGVVFLMLGIKGYWDHPSRWFAMSGIVGLAVVAMILAAALGPKLFSRPVLDRELGN